ncbi:hypothetical protein EV368DRAFT_64156 [Lentinula lateritia]|nr:hypothetical protein EV368DRAFT_64156 [Lentinula lateritia]
MSLVGFTQGMVNMDIRVPIMGRKTVGTYEPMKDIRMPDGCGMLIPPLLHFIWQKLTFDGSDITAEIISASNAASPPATVDQIGRTSKHRQRENDPSDGEHPSSSTLGDHFTSSSCSRGMSYSSGIPASAREILLGSEALVPEGTLNVAPDLDFSEGLPLRTEDLGKLPVHSLPSGYTNAEAQAPAYHMPPNDPVGSTGIPFRIDNSFWGPGTTPAHAALAMFNGASYFEMLTAELLSNGVLCLNQLLILKTETPQTRSIVQNDS